MGEDAAMGRVSPPAPVGALRYAKVAIGRPLEQAYTYLVPGALAETVRVGSLVEVPLRTEKAAGVVVDLSDTADVPPHVRSRIRPIKRHLTPSYHLDPELIELGRWMANYYFCAHGEALGAISMIGLNDVAPKTELRVSLEEPEVWLEGKEAELNEGRATEGHRRVAKALLAQGNAALTPGEVCELAGVGKGVVQTMRKHGWLRATEETVDRDDDYDDGAAGEERREPHTLTGRQQEVYGELSAALHKKAFAPFLLHGVTGSGKTELYLRLIEEGLGIGRTAVVLVPEIALTPQIVQAFRERLGELVGVYHSRLSLGQKLDLYRAVEERRVRVVIGARSALFTPLPGLGVVIVDEEHEGSYKQSETPRYHARDMAVVRAQRAGAVVVMGSATPSIESLHNAREGKYRRLTLPERVGPHASPVMTVVDMKRHIRDAHAGQSMDSLLSPTLSEAIGKRLAAGEQTVLLLNRRGFASQVLCLKCEKAVQCKRCDVSMTYHKTSGRLHCHWCGETMARPETCPACGSEEIEPLGFGTQRIEERIAEEFPQARSLRIDMDSMKRKGAFQEAWRKISRREVDIILGTQMIAKGFHLEAVTLVGVISADFALFLPDFRSAERTYALLTQVAGRAGRGSRPGEVIVQSFIPHHYAIDAAARLAEGEFYERELHLREMLRFPPFGRLAALLVSGPDEEAVKSQAYRLAGILKRRAYRTPGREVRVLGPTVAPIGRIESQYRWRVLVRGTQTRLLHETVRRGLEEYREAGGKGAGGKGAAAVRLMVDVDPIDLL